MISFPSSIALRALAVAAALAGLAWAYTAWANHQQGIGDLRGSSRVQAEWQADLLNIAEQNRIAMMANARAIDQRQAAADKQRSADHVEKNALDLRIDELRRRLRDRPERPAADQGGGNLPAAADVGAAGPGDRNCTGAGLYRSDGEFLGREAARSDRLRIALRSCRAARQADIETVNRASVSQ